MSSIFRIIQKLHHDERLTLVLPPRAREERSRSVRGAISDWASRSLHYRKLSSHST